VAARKPTRWLCDHAAMRIISPEDQNWLFEQWMPALCQAWRGQPARIAVVKANDLFGLRSTLNVAAKLMERRCLDVALFDARNEAQHWLRSSPEQGKG
jgi:hypothetical protein